jgi:hypothetical protein
VAYSGNDIHGIQHMAYGIQRIGLAAYGTWHTAYDMAYGKRHTAHGIRHTAYSAYGIRHTAYGNLGRDERRGHCNGTPLHTGGYHRVIIFGGIPHYGSVLSAVLEHSIHSALPIQYILPVVYTSDIFRLVTDSR